MVDVDSVIAKCVEDIWEEYDNDNSNTLDKEECRRFIYTTIREFGGQKAVETLSDEDFDLTFALFDSDGNGTIDKGEMVKFIRKTAGLPTGRH
mmetsp:Transcript_17329/g.21858  ORF Transcript_17329/g.21858 Transcript_17329/m.21858 type:complete len:93 (-) Transcript_17329:107-385(-)